MKRKLPKSIRKYIRKEKARIRREVLDMKKQNELMLELYSRFSAKANFTKTGDKVKNQDAKIKITNQNAK